MTRLLADNPLLVLFLVIAVGYVAGEVPFGSFRLGTAAVLFAGIGFGAVDSRFALPEVVSTLGLVLFVYTIGIASGPSFFGAIRRRGFSSGGLVIGVLLAAAGVTAAAGGLVGLPAGISAGLFTGSVTNTPALAGILDWLRHQGLEQASAGDPVVGYSLAYPVGVLGTLLGVWFVQRGAHSASGPPADAEAPEPLVCRTARVTRPGLRTLDEELEGGVRVIASRVKRAGVVVPARGDLALIPGDLVTLIGTADAVEAAIVRLGEPSVEHLALDRRTLDMRRVFVSNPALAGARVGDLQLLVRFGAVATRLRRGDVDVLVGDDTVLDLGDRIRIVAPRERMSEVGSYFGDSYRALGEVDELSFAIGIALGLAAGLVPIPLPVGTTLRLGLAGGPLLTGLALGVIGRTGPFVWQLPYGATLTLRQLGTVLFLAGIGTRSGQAFVGTIRDGGAPEVLAVAVVVAAVTVVATVVIGRRLLRLPPGVLTGMLAGLQTQPAALAYANELSASETGPSTGYSTVYPVAMVTKIVLAQILVALLR